MIGLPFSIFNNSSFHCYSIMKVNRVLMCYDECTTLDKEGIDLCIFMWEKISKRYIDNNKEICHVIISILLNITHKYFHDDSISSVLFLPRNHNRICGK
jgi:hypothetical protein